MRNAVKSQKKRDETDDLEAEQEVFAEIVEAHGIALRLFGELATPELGLRVYDERMVDEDDAFDVSETEAAIRRAAKHAEAQFGSAAKQPSLILDVYERLNPPDDE